MRSNAHENIFQLPHPQFNSYCSQGRIAYHLFYLNCLLTLVEDAVGKNCVVLRGMAVIAEVKVQNMRAVDANTVRCTCWLRTPLTNTRREFTATRNIAFIH
jgi:hypothetical protein